MTAPTSFSAAFWDFAKPVAEPITLKKLGAAISAAGEELELSGRKRAFGGRQDQR
jgi:hypothetical protein